MDNNNRPNESEVKYLTEELNLSAKTISEIYNIPVTDVIEMIGKEQNH